MSLKLPRKGGRPALSSHPEAMWCPSNSSQGGIVWWTRLSMQPGNLVISSTLFKRIPRPVSSLNASSAELTLALMETRLSVKH
jgi:hypothetical protein